MKISFTKAATFIDKYGLFSGLGLYLKFKTKRCSKINVPGITNTIHLRKGTSDIAVFDQIFLHDEYKIEFPFSPKLIIDAGANIGLFAILMKNRFPESKVICVESDKNNYALLQQNVKAYNNIETINAGLWNAVTRLNVVDKYENGYSALIVEEDETKGEIASITIDRLMEQYGIDQIDILKIDIETSEEFVFQKGYEQWLPKVRVIIIELHDWIKEGSSRPFFEAINKCFKNYSYTICGENTIIENLDLK